MANPTKTKAKKRKVTITPKGIAHIKATFNNIIITITNATGQTIAWASAGKQGFRGAKKSTPHAARQAAQACGQVAHDLGVKKIEVRSKGIGPGREHAIRALAELGMEVLLIKDITPLPHNGCRAPRQRHP